MEGSEEEQNLKDEKTEIISEQIEKEIKIITKEYVQNVSISKQVSDMIKFEAILGIIEEIVEGIIDNEDILHNLESIMNFKDDKFFHLINVTVLSLMLGSSLKYNKEWLRILGIGAFLHDIGETKVPAKILNKPSKLSPAEFAEEQKHTLYGYEFLEQQENINELSALIAYQHHERCDGSGYPQGLLKRDIHEFSRIVAIADVFDAMRNDRVYRSAFKIKEVIEYLYTMITWNKLDNQLIEKFLECLVPYSIGTKVKLNDNYEGVVTQIKENFNMRPVVKVLKKDGKELDESFEIDLEKKLNFVIEEVG
ncbi:HD-GYP domain-containing protein [Selenihalanaerobacter shriftii]|uniref:HD domain-containing protein n=1 Tax=Selenihalanaerobacter shriftii TaxID=142842 RepID=A0A1T4JMK8_9FIRM|nr:HD domain-containing phosphohydrolase [Selenihalanaerobacter shriftii]SJZ31430.1 HD domain-containing protein [Selenihalanaerobacter shriftii]